MASSIPGTRALRALDAAARHLNFSRAADELGLTPAAVSHQIKEIEDQLGMALFVRTSRTVQLTEAGSVVHEAAVVGAPDDVSYYCRINFADGTTADSESWPSGNGAWVVPLDPAGPTVASVDVLPDGTEKVWSAATFT